MNVVYTSLEALILKATYGTLPCPDEAALEAFCTIMRDAVDGHQLAAQALAVRIHSPNAREAFLALSMLDRCMRRCNASFHAEIGKFRFLNEMIKLVSPKYCASKTAPEVQTMVLQLLHAWSIEYPKETKFKVAYDMLKNQGVVKETPPPLPPEDGSALYRNRPKSAVFEDEEKSKLLQRLLQSKKPEDLQHANRLIKTMVREEERRGEDCRRTAQGARERVGLLRDMLLLAPVATPDEKLLIHELHAGCAELPGALRRLAESPEIMGDELDDILHTYEILEDVLVQYNRFVASESRQPKAPQPSAAQPSNNASLLDFAGSSPSTEQTQNTNVAKTNVIDDLGDIFTAKDSNIAEPLRPINLRPSDTDLKPEQDNKKEGWNDLDSLGEQLLKESLPENAKRVDNFMNKSAKKVPMNALEKTTSPKEENRPSNNTGVLDLDFFTTTTEQASALPNANNTTTNAIDDIMVDISEPAPSNFNLKTICEEPTSNRTLEKMLDLATVLDSPKKEEPLKNGAQNNGTKKNGESEVKPLTDINVTLQSVQPSNVPPIKAFEEENGVAVTLHFCKDKPRPDVNVIVISTISKNSSVIEDYKFQAVVPKGCKVRLLPASSTTLPAFFPFLPPPAVTQIMLVARPDPPPPLNLKFVITYTCGEEHYSEIGEVNSLPLDGI